MCMISKKGSGCMRKVLKVLGVLLTVFCLVESFVEDGVLKRKYLTYKI